MSRRAVPARVGVLLAGFGLVLTFACAKPPPSGPTPSPVAAIDLSPRCLEVEGLPPLSSALEEAVASSALLPLSLPRGVAGWEWRGTAAPFFRVAVGFPWPRGDRESAQLAATLLRESLTATEPARLRMRLAEIGARVEVDVETDRLWYAVVAPRAHADEAFALFFEGLELRPPDPETFARAHRRTRLAQLASETAPAALARARLDQLIGDAPRAPEPGADSADAQLDRMQRFLAVRPSTRVLLLDPPEEGAEQRRAALTDWIEARFAADLDGDSASDAPGDVDVDPDDADAPTATDRLDPGDVLVVDRAGAPQVEVLLALPNAGTGRDDDAALELLANAVGGNVGGRLFVDLRERRGLVYSIDAVQDPRRVFLVSTRALPERIPALVAGVEAHLRALSEIAFLPCEVERWRRRAIGELALESADPAARYAALRRALGAASAPQGEAARRAGFLALDRASLQAAAERHLSARPLVVLVGDRARLEAAFEALDPARALRAIEADGRVD